MYINKKIAIFGCKSTTEILLNFLLSIYKVDVLITIDEDTAKKNNVADFKDLTLICKSKNIKTILVKSYSLKSENDSLKVINEQIDVAFVIGWQRLIPPYVLNSFSIGAFGMHGSSLDLPFGRGRSPMNWSIIEGKNSFYTNLFKYDSGVDSGEILDKYKFSITDKDDAATMHFKNTMSMKYLIDKNLQYILNNNFFLTKQPNYSPSYYPKRTEEDSQIMWFCDVHFIERFIRAVTLPFNGAYSYIAGEKIIILNAQVFDIFEFGMEQKPLGEIVEVFPDKRFIVKCLGGLLLINNYITEISIEKGLFFDITRSCKNNFTRNYSGGFDSLN